MSTIALVHPDHGTHFVYSEDAVEEFRKLGWTVRPENWKELKSESDRLRRVEALKAEQARIAAELESASGIVLAERIVERIKADAAFDAKLDEPKKRGRPRKAV